jgi:glycosyltransferase involved in cell wall biosynthesis
LLHLWQEDHGFRAAAARNRAASQAGGDYLIFLDGDCVPRAGWLAAHRELSEAGWMVAGNRILLSRELTQSVLAAREPIHAWTGQRWRAALASGGINRRWPFLRLPLGPLRKLGRRQWKRVRTCNLGLWRTDFERVNGFDETFEGWGYEDSDLAVRMINAGVQRKDGAFATGVLHLWHRENDRRNEGENWQKLLRRIASGEARAATGLDRSERPPGP